MDFASPDDMARAMVATVRFLRVLVRVFEEGLRCLGFEIVSGRAAPT